MLKRICPIHRTNVNFETFCQSCDFMNKETTGCVAMTLGDRDLTGIRVKLSQGDSLTAGIFSKVGRK